MDRTLCRWILSACVALAACGDVTEQPLAVDATATVAGRVVVDRNGNQQIEGDIDAVAPGVRVALVRGLSDTVATAITDAQGWGLFVAVPVGSYRLVVDPQVLGDTLQLIGGEAARFVATASDTVLASAMLGYPSATAQEVRELRLGRIVTIDGVALHRGNVYGDSILHLKDASGTFRVVQLSPGTAVTAGDSVRVLGRVGAYAGRAALAGMAVYPLGKAAAPAPRPVTAAEAASAGGGGLDAALVEVRGARVLDRIQLPNGDVRLRVDDGTGALEVILDAATRIVQEIEDPLLPGVSIDLVGILVPSGEGSRWQLKPRGIGDLLVDVPRATIAEARRLAPGRLVSITGVALSGIATFGDNTIHVADPSGAIRVFATRSGFLFSGDSLRVLGVIGIRDGQPVLLNAEPAVLTRDALVPPPSLVGTGVAANANGGRLDAALVEVRGAVIDSVETSSAGAALRANDGSGELIILLDPDTGIGSAVYTKGERIDAIGVLVPRPGGGAWMLKPRSPADIRK